MKNIYLGYGCVNATISGIKLVIDCWKTTTSMVVGNLYCNSVKGEVTLTKEIPESTETDSWSAYISPNTYFLLEVQGQHEVVMYWNGTDVFEVASAWFGGGDGCFSVIYKGAGWNKDIRRKKMGIFKGISDSSEWADACKALQIVDFI